LKVTIKKQLTIAGNGPAKPAPRFVGNIIAFLLNLVSFLLNYYEIWPLLKKVSRYSVELTKGNNNFADWTEGFGVWSLLIGLSYNKKLSVCEPQLGKTKVKNQLRTSSKAE
jgi:hypothetical protein